MQFRSAQPPLIDFDTPNINCLVTFPSGHTILGLVTTYALRDRLYTFSARPAAQRRHDHFDIAGREDTIWQT
jgi:hypothetical protein